MAAVGFCRAVMFLATWPVPAGPLAGLKKLLRPLFGLATALRRAGFHRFADERKLVLLALAILFLPVPGFPFWEAVKHDVEELGPDARTVATEWIENNVPEGSGIINDAEVVKLKPDGRRIDWLLDRWKAMRAAKNPNATSGHKYLFDLGKKANEKDARPTYDVLVFEHAWWAKWESESAETNSSMDFWPRLPIPASVAPGLSPVERYAQPNAGLRSLLIAGGRPFRYLVTDEERYVSYRSEYNQEHHPSWHAFYKDLEANYACKVEINADHAIRGPTIRIYDISARRAR
jgi:hypothetical protein